MTLCTLDALGRRSVLTVLEIQKNSIQRFTEQVQAETLARRGAIVGTSGCVAFVEMHLRSLLSLVECFGACTFEAPNDHAEWEQILSEVEVEKPKMKTAILQAPRVSRMYMARFQK